MHVFFQCQFYIGLLTLIHYFDRVQYQPCVRWGFLPLFVMFSETSLIRPVQLPMKLSWLTHVWINGYCHRTFFSTYDFHTWIVMKTRLIISVIYIFKALVYHITFLECSYGHQTLNVNPRVMIYLAKQYFTTYLYVLVRN